MAREPGDAVYIISVAAELAGVHPQTLRIYERRGLISPHRTPGGTRRYSERDLEILGMIQELTAEGLNLEGVRQIMEMRLEIDRLQKQVTRLRRLLGEAEHRYRSGSVPRVAYATVRKRNLPDVPRPGLGGMIDK